MKVFRAISLPALILAACAAPDRGHDELLRRATVAEAQGRWIAAGEAWHELLRSARGRDSRAARGLARALAAQGDSGGALRVLQGAREPGGTDARLLFDLASLLRDVGQGELAIETFAAAADADPGWAAPRLEEGALLVARGRPGPAVSSLRAAIALGADDARVHLLLALASEAEGDRGGALTAWAGAFERGALTVERALRAARLARSEPDGPETEAPGPDGPGPDVLRRVASWLEDAVDLDPQRGEAYALLAELRFALGDQDRGLAALRRAVEVDPGDLDTLYQLAARLAGSGDHRQLVLLVEHALAVTDEAPERARFLALLEGPAAGGAEDSDPPGDEDGDI